MSEYKRNTLFINATTSISDLSPEFLWEYFVEHQVRRTEDELPSTHTLSDINNEVESYLDKYFTRICASVNKKTPKKLDSDYDGFLDSDNEVGFYKGYRGLKTVIIKHTKGEESGVVTICSLDIKKVESLSDGIRKDFTYQPKNVKFGILTDSGHGISVRKMDITDAPLKLDLDLNYGTGFSKTHELIVKRLTDNKKGIFIFHGPTGTGKTTYIKYLCGQISAQIGRSFIFIPTNMVDALTSPSIINLLINHPNSVLVLEDAEKAITSREEDSHNASLVSTLLNLSDGILSSMLKISVLITFNTSREKIDKALLRKGRLLAEHYFDNLSLDDSKKLASKIGADANKIKEPTSLADIYNLEVDNFHKEDESRKIGFQP